MQLLAEESLNASQRDLVNTIRCSGETLLILITDILDFSRIEANKMVLSLHEFKLRAVVEAAMEIAGLSAAAKRLQVDLKYKEFGLGTSQARAMHRLMHCWARMLCLNLILFEMTVLH